MITRAGLTHLHVFPYSVRTGTPAARMPQLSGDVIKKRAGQLRDEATQRLHGFLTMPLEAGIRFWSNLVIVVMGGDMRRCGWTELSSRREAYSM